MYARIPSNSLLTAGIAMAHIMKSGNKMRVFTVLLIILTLTVQSGHGAGSRQFYECPSDDIEATVISVRQYDSRTYLDVLRDDGHSEWIEIGRGDAEDVVPYQRIAYSPESIVYENSTLGRVRHAHNFRFLPPRQQEERVYRGSRADGSIILTDNPTKEMVLQGSVTDTPKKEKRKSPKQKGPKKQEQEEVVVVDQEELLLKEKATEDYYRSAERANVYKPARRAKRAKSWW